MDAKQRAVSVVANALDNSGGDRGTVEQVLEIIRGERYRQAIAWIRECHASGDEDAALEAKKQLPAILWAGAFSKRCNTGCAEYSGLVVADIDGIDDAEELRDQMQADRYSVCGFVSPRGEGVKVIFNTAAQSPDDHGAAWEAVRAHVLARYSREIDPSGCDVARLCFVSHDPQAWINAGSEPLPIADGHRAKSASREVSSRKVDPGSLDKIRKDRHQYLCTYTARMAAIGATAPEIIAAAKQLVASRFDLSDGRRFDDGEIARCVDGAIAKYAGSMASTDDVMHGASIIDGMRKDPVPELRVVDPGNLPARLLRLPGIGQIWMEDILSRSWVPQPDLAIGSILVAAGCLIGRRLETSHGGRANLYGFAVADTGHGKEASRDYAKTLFSASNAGDWLGPEDLASDAGLIQSIDSQQELLILLDEAGYLLGAAGQHDSKPHMSGIIASLLRLYTSSHQIWKGKAYADKTRGVTIAQPHCCLWATTTPDKLWSSMTRDSITGGLLGRCLFFFGQDQKPSRQRPRVRLPDQVLVDAIRQWQMGCDGARKNNPNPDMVEVLPEAEDIFDAAQDECDAWEKLHRDNAATPVFARLVQQAERVALIYSWLKNRTAPVIDSEAAAWSVDLVRHCTLRLASAAQDRVAIDGGAWERAYLRVLALVAGAGEDGMARSVLLQRARLPARALDEMVATAIASETIAAVERSGGRGRPGIRYVSAANAVPCDGVTHREEG
jgi:hypothetical protein